jgi:hypothetical protein
MMDENNIDAIYEFGKEIVIKARERTIGGIEQLLNGEARDEGGKKIFKELMKLNLNSESRVIIQALMIDCIDGAINNLFWDFEQSLEKYRIVTKDKNGNDFDIVTGSDGLCTGQWMFIDEFSKYKTADEILASGQMEK